MDNFLSEDGFADQKQDLLERWAKAGWLNNPRLGQAFLAVPRTAFIQPEQYPQAYRDEPLPIGYGQTISQPSTVIRMLSVLDVKPGHHILEVGAGCGYQAALLAFLSGAQGRVHSIDIIDALVDQARANWQKLKGALAQRPGLDEAFGSIEFVKGDGSSLTAHGDNSVYDRIIAACACPQIPYGWQRTVKTGGRILAPVGGRRNQRLVMATKVDQDNFETEYLGYFRFVPLRGRYGFPVK